MTDCSLCRDTGWLLDAKDKNGVVTMEIYPCLIPDCVKSGQPIILLSMGDMLFNHCSRHPKTGDIMSLSKTELHGEV